MGVDSKVSRKAYVIDYNSFKKKIKRNATGVHLKISFLLYGL